MTHMPEFVPLTCSQCAKAEGLSFDFSMAYQPIVDTDRRNVYGYESLVRGLNNESAYSILSRVTDDTRYRFDQACRVKAIQLAAQLGLNRRLHINFLPNAIYKAETCIRTTIEAAAAAGFPVGLITFEVTEGEEVSDHAHLLDIIRTYQRLGFQTAIDDFGAGYSGLNLLAEFQPNLVKLDMALTRNIDKDRVRRAIVAGVLTMCEELQIEVVAEGIESRDELKSLQDLGVRLFQGFYFAKPAFESLPLVAPTLYTADVD